MIALDNVSKKVGAFQVKNLSLTIAPGEYIVVLGPTGAGKTVLLDLISGFLKPDCGTITLAGQNAQTLPPNERQIGRLYQDFMLFPHYTVAKNIAYGLVKRKVADASISDKVAKIAEQLGISHLLQRFPRHLSGGEKQRTALARAMVFDPQLILLDEPFSSLDTQTRARLIQDFRTVQQSRKYAFIHVSHDFEEAMQLADRVCVVHNGELQQIGTPEHVMFAPRSTFVAEFLGARNIFQGHTQVDNHCKFVTKHVSFLLPADAPDAESMVIRPDHISVNLDAVPNADNQFQGRILDVLKRHYVHEIVVDIGVPLVCYVPKTLIHQLKPHPGQSVWISVRPEDIHTIKGGLS